jgi:DNA-binding IclR family transcriptional regulator
MDKTVAKAFRLLEFLVEADEPIGITEIAKQLSFTKSNVHRTLDTLRQLGYIDYLPEGRRYTASFKLWEMGTRISDRLDLKQIAAPYLQALSDETGETIHLCQLSGTEVVYLDKIECKHHLRPATRIGGRAPAHCVSTGKAILAFQPPSVVDEVMKHLEKHTPQTIVSKANFKAELEKIKEQQIAFNRGEWHAETIGAAAPIRNVESAVIAAVGVSIPKTRAKLADLKKITPSLSKAAGAISAALGYRPER